VTGTWAAVRKSRVIVPLVFVLLLTAFQVRTRAGWGTGWRPSPIREGLPTAENGVPNRGFTFCRLLYQSVRREQGGYGWNTDYPGSDYNFVTRMEELTTAKPARWADGEPGYAVVRPTQEELFECPFIFMSDVGTAGFNAAEVASLRDYLLKGGFIWVDDFWGNWAWEQWESQIRLILPEYSIIDIGPEHMIMHALYSVEEVPQIPSIQWWRRNGGYGTSERGRESETPHLRAIFHEDGRPLVIMTHNTDIADGWEREGEEDDYFFAFSPQAYALGINVVLYSLSH
jgi:uncharacterized protein DUF4159